MTPLGWGLLAASGFAAGAVNAVAGGGSLLTFPALLGVGFGSLTANATSTVGLVAGSASAAWRYRAHLATVPRERLVAVLVPSVVGGVVGARVVVAAGEAFFDAMVPLLVLGATALFAAAEPLKRWVGSRLGPAGSPRARIAALVVLQLLVAVYGGFFGAGIGILMLAGFALAGEVDVHRANALKSLAALAINGSAALSFLLAGEARLVPALVLAVASTAGGAWGAGLALRIGPTEVRRAVVAIGVAIGLWQLIR